MPRTQCDIPSECRKHEKYFAEKNGMTETEAILNLSTLGITMRSKASKIAKLLMDIPHLTKSEMEKHPEKMGGVDVMLFYWRIFANYTDKEILHGLGDSTIITINMDNDLYTTYKKAANKAKTTMRQMLVVDMWTGIITDLAADRIEDEVESDILKYGRNMTSRQIGDIMKKKTFVKFVRNASVWRQFQTSETAKQALNGLDLKNAPEILPSGAKSKHHDQSVKESIHD